MQHWHQGDVAVGDASLHWFRSGGDLPPLVFVHGFTDHALYFTRVAEALATQWDVIAYDQRGHGTSSRSVGVFDVATLASDLVAVVDALALDRPALLGHSLGGAVVTNVLATAPTLSRGGVLEDPFWAEPAAAPTDEHRAAFAEYIASWRTWVEDLQRAPRAEALAQRLADEPAWSPIDVETALDGRLAFQVDLFDQFPTHASPWRDRVTQFRVPALLMTGAALDRGPVVQRKDAEQAVSLNPLVQWVHVEGAGHHIKYDRFDEFLAAVTAFLAPLR